MGLRTPQEVFGENGVNFERAMIQKAQALACRDRIAKAFNIDPERLLSLKSIAEIQTDGQQRMVQTQAASEGKEAPDLTAEKEINQGAQNDLEPSISRPVVPDGVNNVLDESLSIDNIPKQNQGLDRPLDQPRTIN